jgi:hypothetical protein
MIPALISISIASLILIVLIWVLRTVRTWTLRRLEKIAALPERFPPSQGIFGRNSYKPRRALSV